VGRTKGGFPPEVPLIFKEVRRATLENFNRYVHFKRSKRCTLFGYALSALEFFTNFDVYTGKNGNTGQEIDEI